MSLGNVICKLKIGRGSSLNSVFIHSRMSHITQILLNEIPYQMRFFFFFFGSQFLVIKHLKTIVWTTLPNKNSCVSIVQRMFWAKLFEEENHIWPLNPWLVWLQFEQFTKKTITFSNCFGFRIKQVANLQLTHSNGRPISNC